MNVDLILDTEFPVIKIEVLYVKLRDEFFVCEKVLNPEDKLYIDITVSDDHHYGREAKNFI